MFSLILAVTGTSSSSCFGLPSLVLTVVLPEFPRKSIERSDILSGFPPNERKHHTYKVKVKASYLILKDYEERGRRGFPYLLINLKRDLLEL